MISPQASGATKPVHWKGYCNQTRNAAIYEIENIVGRYGYITGYQMFSDLEISVTVEIEERKISGFYSALCSYVSLSETKDLNSDSSRERIILLNITFTKGTGNLKIEVPAVPG